MPDLVSMKFEGWKERLDALDVPLDAIEVHRFGRAGEQLQAVSFAPHQLNLRTH